MQRKIFLISILVSLLLHFGLLLSIYFTKPHSPRSKDAIEVTILEPKQPANQVKQKIIKANQIVDQQQKAMNNEVPPDTKFLSRYNQHVIHETKAAQSGAFRNTTGGVKSTQSLKPSASHQARHNVAHHGPGHLPKLKDLMPNYSWSPKASETAMENGQGPSQTDDYLKGVQNGPQTLLNSREFIYFTYYERIKAKIRQYWEPDIKQKIALLLAQGRSIASSQDHVTKMIIILDAHGKLLRVQIIGASGVRDLDDAAVEAFRAAAPFPNPPAGIVDPDGTIKIRWDFILQA